jgi:hypothetical protein
MPWGPSLVSVRGACYDSQKDDLGVSQVEHIKRRIVWILFLVPALTGCQPLEDLGKLVDDLLKRFTG